MKKETLELDGWDRRRAEKFATERCGEDQSLYKKRGGFKRDDILVGALGEIAVYKFLTEHGFKVNKPDFAIYEKKDKSFASDLTDGMRHFHVKAQSCKSAKLYGESWLLQKRDPLVNNPGVYDYVIPCVVDLNTNTAVIYGIISFRSIIRNACVGECKVHQLRNSKVALYMNEMKDLSHKVRWGVVSRNTRSRSITKY
jgi:hypothetical protein